MSFATLYEAGDALPKNRFVKEDSDACGLHKEVESFV